MLLENSCLQEFHFNEIFNLFNAMPLNCPVKHVFDRGKIFLKGWILNEMSEFLCNGFCLGRGAG